MSEPTNKIAHWLWNIVQAADRLLNAICGGSDKEYASSRIYRYRNDNRFAGWMYRFLNWLEAEHCEKAYADAQIGFDPDDDVLR